MKKQLFVFSVLGLIMVGFFSGCVGPQVTAYFNEEYSANEDTVVRVSTINGKLEVYGWDGDTVKVDAVKKSRVNQDELDKMEITVTESEDVIDIDVEYTGTRSVTPSVDMNIKIPENISVASVKSSNGNVIIDGVRGDVVAESSNGGIYLQDVDGYVAASTSNGRIDIEKTTGVGDLETSNGMISA